MAPGPEPYHTATASIGASGTGSIRRSLCGMLITGLNSEALPADSKVSTPSFLRRFAMPCSPLWVHCAQHRERASSVVNLAMYLHQRSGEVVHHFSRAAALLAIDCNSHNEGGRVEWWRFGEFPLGYRRSHANDFDVSNGHPATTKTC